MINHSTSIRSKQRRPGTKLKLDRVLVVDDMALNREILIVLLGDAVRHIDEAADGLAALTLFKQRFYDAVLLDIQMPGLDGYGVMNELRIWEQAQRLPLTPVVAITSSDFPEDEQRILAAGATAYLVKPVKRQELLSVLQLHCIVEPASHPMANLLPRFFASAWTMLDEMAGLEDQNAISTKLHQLRGLISTYGFVEFAERLKQIHSGVQRGEMPSPAELEQLRHEFRHLETVSRKRP